ncbi:MAG: TniQ family protein [Anaerolineae bacterium]|nr:TniQ family protein [Anaerolineae bacterium]
MAEMEMTLWETHIPAHPAVSVLYPLAPVGVGTPFVESLTSYLKRLAQAHHLKVVDLVAFCGTRAETDILPSTLQKLSRIDGMTDSGAAWSALLRDLTCQDEVVCLSMSYWRLLLNPYRILRQCHAWCPLCFTDAVQHETPLYEPLAWRLQAVEVCIRHGHLLVEQCPACGTSFTTLSNWAVVGYCPKCESWLGKPTSTHQRPLYATESCKRAEAVGKLLSLAPETSPNQCSGMRYVIPFLRQQQHTTHTHFARVMQTTPSALSMLLAETRLPNLAIFSRLAADCGELFWQALTQPDHADQISGTCAEVKSLHTDFDLLLTTSQRLPPLQTLARQLGFGTTAAFQKAFPAQYDLFSQRIHAEQRAVLELALQQEHPVVLSKWVQQHGYRTGDLYHRFYDLCVQVTQRFHTDKEARCRGYLQTFLSEQTLPTLTEICSTLNVGVHYLKQHFGDELQVIEARRQAQLEHHEAFVEAYLERMLTEGEPALSLNQIAEALGKSLRYLKNHFPLQSRVLVVRRHEHVARHVEATCDRIRQSVLDLHQRGIYPSVDRIHSVIGSWMVHGNAYRHAYNEAMTLCGYLSTPSQ